MYNIQVYFETLHCFNDLIFSEKFSRQATGVFKAAKQLITVLDEVGVENDLEYKKIILGTMIIAMAVEDKKYRKSPSFSDEYPDYTLDDLFLKIPGFEACYINSLEMLWLDANTLMNASLKAIMLVGEKALSDPSLCQGNFREDHLEKLKDILPEDLSKQMFGHRAQYEEQKPEEKRPVLSLR